MNPGIEARPVPGWLPNVDQASDFPVREVLQDSLYYAASGLDSDPVSYLYIEIRTGDRLVDTLIEAQCERRLHGNGRYL